MRLEEGGGGGGERMDVGLGTFGRSFKALAGGCGSETGHGFVFVLDKRSI